MAEHKAEHKMSVTEASNVFTPFKNLFRAAERLEEACAVATHLEGETSRLKEETKEAQAEAKEAIEARDKAKALLETTNERLAGVKRDFERAVQAENEAIDKFVLQCREETERIRASHVEERKAIVKATLALEAKRSDLAKVVREMEKPPGEPAGSSQARVEP